MSSECSPLRWLISASALGAAALLAGCTTPAPLPAPTPVAAPVAPICTPASEAAEHAAEARAEVPGTSNAVPPPEGNVALLAYADRVRAMAPAELAQEITRLNDIQDARRAPFQDMQLVVALGQTRAPQDTQRAQTLLQRLLAQQGDEARRLQPLARMIFARYGEQRRLEDMLDRQSQQLRDNQRKIDQLNERLEAVRAIERSLTRPGAASGSAAPRAAP
jgi:Tfp pilus assembly protein PilN